jgi:hypothetical protein
MKEARLRVPAVKGNALRARVIRLRRKADAKLGQHHFRVRAERRKDAGGTGHRGEDADLLTPAVLLECPCGGEADGRDTGHDAESLCHGTGTRQVNEFRFVHGLLQIKGEHGPPEEPDDVIASWWKEIGRKTRPAYAVRSASWRRKAEALA